MKRIRTPRSRNRRQPTETRHGQHPEDQPPGIRPPPAAAHGTDGAGQHCRARRRARAHAQPGCGAPLPAGQRLLVSHRLSRARSGHGAAARARARRVRALLPRARPGARGLGRFPGGPGRRLRAVRRRRCLPHRRYRRHSARADRGPRAGLLRPGPGRELRSAAHALDQQHPGKGGPGRASAGGIPGAESSAARHAAVQERRRAACHAPRRRNQRRCPPACHADRPSGAV